MVIYKADKFVVVVVVVFVSVVNKSQYRDTQKTPSVTCEILITFPLFEAGNSKQRTINTICM